MDGQVVRYVIYLAVALFITAYLVPPAFDAIFNQTMTNWNPAVKAIFTTLLPILAIIGIGLAFMPKELKGKLGV